MATKNNLFKLSYKDGMRDGRKLASVQFIEMCNNRICFDHKANNRCDHAGCYQLVEMKNKLGDN